MKQSAYIRQSVRMVLAVLLSAALVLFGTPAAFAFADEAEESSAASSSSEPAPAQEEAPSEAPEPAAPEPEAPAPAPAPAPSSDPSSTTNDDASSQDTSDASSASEATPSRNNLSTETEYSQAAARAKNVEEAQRAYDKAFDAASEALGQLGSMADLQANLAPSFDKLALAWNELEAAKGLREPLEKERKECEEAIKGFQAELKVAKEERAEALYGLLLVDMELSQAGQDGIVAVLVGVSNATEAETSEYLLERVALAQAKAKEAADARVEKIENNIAAKEKRITEIEAEIKEVEKKKAEAQKALEEVVDEGNIAAFAIEKLASQARQASKEAVTSVEKLSDKIEGVKDLKESAKEWDLASNGVRADALAQAGLWYDTVDSLVGLEGAISYGCGLDFALEEKDFVAKWGPAIDAFFVSQGAPLQGYGNEMARQAYVYKVDPRLCAAVSIVESSGGRYCIKPHNAWGWGAADSDPYNLASGWGSWEEAIEAWHYGMASSQTGLATTPSLTAMGDIYCSTPIWGSKVAMLMEQISGYVVPQQVVVQA